MNMRKSVIVITLLLASAFAGRAQQKATFTYGADFQYYFDNREYDGAGNKFETSGTVHAARLTPTVGVKVAGGRFTHQLTLGIDVMKNMGEAPVSESDKDLQNIGLFREMTFWYGLESRRRSGKIQSLGGNIPARELRFRLGLSGLGGGSCEGRSGSVPVHLRCQPIL